MAYLDEVLALNPDISWPADDSGATVADASGNGRDGSMLSLSGTQYVRQVEALVRNTPDQANGLATLLNSSLTATSGVGRIVLGDGSNTIPGLSVLGSYSYVIWARWKRVLSTLNHFVINGSQGSGAISFLINTGSIRIDHVQPGHIGGSQTRTFNYLDDLLLDSRHMFGVRYDAVSGMCAVFIDGVKIGEQSHQAIHSSMTLRRILIGDSNSAPQQPLRHYVQHADYWFGTALTDSDFETLWESGRDRPGRFASYVDFSESDYSDGVAVPSSIWPAVFATTTPGVATVHDRVGAVGGRIVDFAVSGGAAARYWAQSFREPLQRCYIKFRPKTGTNLAFDVVLLGCWDWTSSASYGSSTNAVAGIAIGVSNDKLVVKGKVLGSPTELANTAFSYSADDWLHMKAEVDSITQEIRAKIWHDGDDEPDDWMIDINTMPDSFFYGEGFFAIQLPESNSSTEIDFINLEYNSGDPIPNDPTIDSITTECGSTTIIGSELSGGSGVLKSSNITIRVKATEEVLESIDSDETEWLFSPVDLPFGIELEAQISYTDTNDQTATSEWVTFTRIEPPTFGSFIISPDATNITGEVTLISWTTPPFVTGGEEVGKFFSYTVQLNVDGGAYETFAAAITENSFYLDLSNFVGSQVGIKVIAEYNDDCANTPESEALVTVIATPCQVQPSNMVLIVENAGIDPFFENENCGIDGNIANEESQGIIPNLADCPPPCRNRDDD